MTLYQLIGLNYYHLMLVVDAWVGEQGGFSRSKRAGLACPTSYIHAQSYPPQAVRSSSPNFCQALEVNSLKTMAPFLRPLIPLLRRSFDPGLPSKDFRDQ